MRLIYVLFSIILLNLPMVASADYLNDKWTNLVKEKQELISELEKCQKNTKGFKIAGLATLGVSAIGIGVNIGEAVKINSLEGEINQAQQRISNLDTEINKAKNTCGTAKCGGTPSIANATKHICINDEWKVETCAATHKGQGEGKCKRDGKDITYYNECVVASAGPARAVATEEDWLEFLPEVDVVAPARPDECKNKAVHLSEAHRRPRIKGFFQVDVESGSVIRHGNGEWLPTLENFGGELVLKPVYVCPDGQYLNVSNLRFGRTQANGYNKELHTNIAISSGVKCSNSCDTYSFEYDVDRAVGLHEEDVVFTKQACLIGDKGFNVLLDACLQYCKKNKEAKEGAINQKECKITGVAIDVEAQNCLCNPTGVRQYRYYKYNNGEEL